MKIFLSHMVFVLFALSFAMSSCNKPILFDETKDIAQPWQSSDKISYLVDVNDTISPFNFLIDVRNDVDYNFSNIFFFVKTIFPDGRYARDTINIWLANPDGKWIGKGFGKYRDTEIIFKKNGRFPMSGIYRFEFEQAMRVPELNGIESLGIRIEYGE